MWVSNSGASWRIVWGVLATPRIRARSPAPSPREGPVPGILTAGAAPCAPRRASVAQLDRAPDF